MGWEIVKQPSGRYARFTTVTMSNTHVNKSREEMIAILMKDYRCSADEARVMVDGAPLARRNGFDDFGPYQSGRL